MTLRIPAQRNRIAKKPERKKLKRFLIHEDAKIKEAMRQMGEAGNKLLFVVDDDNRLLGSLSDGDIRRWVLSEGKLTSRISKVYNTEAISVNQDYEIEDVKELLVEKRIEGVPVVDQNDIIQDVLLWSNIFVDKDHVQRSKIDLPVVIMAGGRGTRLDPFTKVLPKPLIPINEKTIIEMIIDKYRQYHVDEIYVSINHKSKMMKAYFEEINPEYKLHFVEEKKPLGTAGSIRLIQEKITDHVLVSNCDILIDCDYSELVKFHKSNDHDITIVGSFRHFTVPYGICQISNGGALVDIDEKPEYDFLVNTGMYVLRKEAIKHIEKNKYFNITDLIRKVQRKGGSVGVFPIDAKSWIDVGQWKEYRKALKLLDLGE